MPRDMNDAELADVQPVDDGVRLDAVHSDYGEDPLRAVMAVKDPAFRRYLVNWLSGFVGMKLGNIREQEIEY